MSPCATARTRDPEEAAEGAQRREDIGDDMPAVEMMLGHAPAMEQVAWQALENGALKPAPLEKSERRIRTKGTTAPEKISARASRAPREKVPDKKLRRRREPR